MRLLLLYLSLPYPPGGPGPPGPDSFQGKEASRNEPERTCDPPVIPADRPGIQHLLHDAGCDRGPSARSGHGGLSVRPPGAGPDPGVSGGLCGGGVRLPPSDGAEQYGGRPVRLCHRPAAGHEPPGDRSLLGAGAGRCLCHRGGQAVLRRAGTELYESRSGGTGRCCAPFPD